MTWLCVFSFLPLLFAPLTIIKDKEKKEKKSDMPNIDISGRCPMAKNAMCQPPYAQVRNTQSEYKKKRSPAAAAPWQKTPCVSRLVRKIGLHTFAYFAGGRSW